MRKIKHNPFKKQIRFHWEKSALGRKSAKVGDNKAVYKPSLNRGKTIGTEDVMKEFIDAEGLERMFTPGVLTTIVRKLLEHMVKGVLTDGRSRQIDDFFTVRLDMKGTAESIGEQFNPYKHKFTINFQKARRFSEKSKMHRVEIIGEPVCEIPPSRSRIKDVHSQGAGIGEVYIGRQIIIEGKDLELNPRSQVALAVDYPVGRVMYGCPIVSSEEGRIVVESPRRFAMKYMRESAIGLTGEIVVYMLDEHRPHRQAAHGSRFKVKFVRPPSA